MFLEKFPYRVKFYTKMKLVCETHIQKVQRERFLRWTGLRRRVLKFDGLSGRGLWWRLTPQVL